MNSVPNLLNEKGDAYLFTRFWTEEESQSLLLALTQIVAWRHEPIWMFGKKVMQPRLTAWYGDPGKSYRYSGIEMNPLPWIPELQKIKEKVEKEFNLELNSALLNLYRDGQDSMGWHRDHEPELGVDPVIASVSFGAPRRFLMRQYDQKNSKVEILLESGSLLLMQGQTQHYWEHSIPKSAKVKDPRINITFRKIV
jgi:alkylated DNA repair dioxygenase AlkB